MPKFRKKPVVIEAITFEEFVQHGKDYEGSNIVNGYPWSFKYNNHPITHENDECYCKWCSQDCDGCQQSFPKKDLSKCMNENHESRDSESTLFCEECLYTCKFCSVECNGGGAFDSAARFGFITTHGWRI